MPRTVNTGLGALFVLVALAVLGRDSLVDFAVALLIGIVVGTYSSVFLAAPLAIVFESRPGGLVQKLAVRASATATGAMPPEPVPPEPVPPRTRPPQERDDMDIERVNLPGIGMRHAITTERGTGASGVVSHHTGRRDLVVYDNDDPDTAVVTVTLTGTRPTRSPNCWAPRGSWSGWPSCTGRSTAWSPSRSPIAAGSPYDGRTLGDTAARTRTGASIVAVVRGRAGHRQPPAGLPVRTPATSSSWSARPRAPRRSPRSSPTARGRACTRSLLLIEIGAIILGARPARRAVASRLAISPIPLYLLAGLAFGQGGVLPLATSEEFIATGAEIGVILLLFTLGLEYTAPELVGTLRTSPRPGWSTWCSTRRPASPWRCCSAGDRWRPWRWAASPT